MMLSPRNAFKALFTFQRGTRGDPGHEQGSRIWQETRELPREEAVQMMVAVLMKILLKYLSN